MNGQGVFTPSHTLRTMFLHCPTSTDNLLTIFVSNTSTTSAPRLPFISDGSGPCPAWCMITTIVVFHALLDLLLHPTHPPLQPHLRAVRALLGEGYSSTYTSAPHSIPKSVELIHIPAGYGPWKKPLWKGRLWSKIAKIATKLATLTSLPIGQLGSS
jgi:hypothetical protein